MNDIINLVSLVSNILTILASGIAIYLFCTKRKEISSVFHVLINYTQQLSLSEIKEKIERLNEYNAKDPEHSEKIINILNEIVGQIKGNDKLKTHFAEILITIDQLSSGKKRLTEPKKRAVVSELREKLRHMNIKNIDGLVGEL